MTTSTSGNTVTVHYPPSFGASFVGVLQVLVRLQDGVANPGEAFLLTVG